MKRTVDRSTSRLYFFVVGGHIYIQGGFSKRTRLHSSEIHHYLGLSYTRYSTPSQAQSLSNSYTGDVARRRPVGAAVQRLAVSQLRPTLHSHRHSHSPIQLFTKQSRLKTLSARKSEMEACHTPIDMSSRLMCHCRTRLYQPSRILSK